MVDLETATTRLYEEANLTDELVDQDATTLLKWAEQQVAELVAKYGSDETAFETAFSALRSLIKNMNRYVGQQEMSDESQQSQRLENITQSASEIGFEMTPTFGAQSLARNARSKSELLQTMLNSLQKSGAAQGAKAQDAKMQATDEPALKVQSPSASPDRPRHTRQMIRQQTEDTASTDSTEPQQITEDRVVRVFTVSEEQHSEIEDTSQSKDQREENNRFDSDDDPSN